MKSNTGTEGLCTCAPLGNLVFAAKALVKHPKGEIARPGLRLKTFCLEMDLHQKRKLGLDEKLHACQILLNPGQKDWILRLENVVFSFRGQK